MGDVTEVEKRLGIVSVDVPIAFVTEEFARELKALNQSWGMKVLSVEDFDKAEWHVDLEILRDTFPCLIWHVSADEVDPKHFSIEDLWYATI